MNKIYKNKAFTLIELMIVVVILGILMSTVLPKLTWAQARARDTARIADLGNISAALNAYYDDNWEFPWDSWMEYCLSGSWWVAANIKDYLQNQTVPQDPQAFSNSKLCWPTASNDSWVWKYFYKPLTKKTLLKNAYMICADVETYQKANTDAEDFIITAGATTTNAVMSDEYDDFSKILEKKLTSEASNAWYSVYCILRP